MKLRFPICLLCALSLFFGTLYAASGERGSRQRAIGRLPIERNEPLRIRTVKVAGRRLLRNEKFDGDEGWLKNFSMRFVGKIVIDIEPSQK